MNQVLKKLFWRNILHNIKHFVLVILIVFLSFTLISGFIANTKTLKNTVNKYFDQTNLANLWLSVDKIDSNDEQFFKDNDINFEKRLNISTIARIKNKDFSNNANIYVYDETEISTPYIISGIGTCFVDKNVANNNGIKIGQDYIEFEIQFPFEMGKTATNINLDFSLPITGTMSICECADIYSSWPVLIEKNYFLQMLNSNLNKKFKDIMPHIDFENLKVLPYNEILIDCSEDIEGVSSKISKFYLETSQNNLLFLRDRNSIESVVLLNDEVNQSQKMLYVFPAIFLIVAILIILTTINELILQDKQKIGTLKSIGIDDSKILRHYSRYGFVLCLIGCLLGAVVGPFLIPDIMFVKYNLVYSLPSDFIFLIYPIKETIILLIAICLLGYVVSFFASKGLIKQKPTYCLKPDIPLKFNVRKHKQKKMPFTIKLGLRNIKIKPFRTAMAVIGIAGCIALLLCGFGINDTLNYSLNKDLNETFSYDVSSSYKLENFETKLLQNDEIENFEIYEKFYGNVNGNSKNVVIFNIKENSIFTKFKTSNGNAVISKSIAEKQNIKVGDEITLSVGEKIYKTKISQIYDTAFINGVFVSENLNFDELLSTKCVWIKTNNAKDVAVYINAINGTCDAETKLDNFNNAESKISSISLMTTTLKVFAIMLAILVLINLFTLILKERSKDIATLKVLGKSNFYIIKSIFAEIVFICLFGLILGFLCGYPLLVLVLKINAIEVVNYIYHLNELSFVYSFLIEFATLIFVGAFSLLKARKIKMVEALKSNE